MKTMHKILTLLLIVGLTGLYNASTVAQMNEKFKKQAEEQKKENKDENKPDSKLEQFKEETPAEKKAPAKTQKKEQAPEEVVAPEPAVFTPKVIEYTHTTSAQAKETQLLKRGELTASVTSADTKVQEARMKLVTAREVLEKDKKAKRIKDAVYYEKLDKIMKAEKAVNDLELIVQKGKELTAE